MNNFQNATITSIFRFVFGKTPAGKSHDFQKAPLKLFFGSHENAMLVFPHSFGLKNWPNRKDKVAFSKS